MKELFRLLSSEVTMHGDKRVSPYQASSLKKKVPVLGTACLVQFHYLLLQISLQREIKVLLNLPYIKMSKGILISACLQESV